MDNSDQSDELSNPEPNTCNPSLSGDLQAEDIAIMKGDAIGDTLYSERFVLSTLIKLTKNTEFSESFEKELCAFWDMTIERDVVLLLLKHNSFKLLTNAIQNETNNRFIEILIGIIANMSCFYESRKELSFDKNSVQILLDVINTQDCLILIQLMRFITSVLVFENTGDEYIWFEHFENKTDFFEQLAFILHNSTNSILLVNTLEALIALCAKFVVLEIEENSPDKFMQLFVKNDIISGVIEAFKQTMPMQLLDGDDTNLPTHKQQKICNLFLEINCILTQYGDHSSKIYQEHLNEIFMCMNVILHPLTKSMYLIPFTQNTQGVIENITEILSSLNDPFDSDVLVKLFKIWNLAGSELCKLNKDQCDIWEKENSNNSQDEYSSGSNICIAISEYFIKIINAFSENLLEKFIQNNFTSDMTQDLLNKLKSTNVEEETKAYHKLKLITQKTVLKKTEK